MPTPVVIDRNEYSLNQIRYLTILDLIEKDIELSILEKEELALLKEYFKITECKLNQLFDQIKVQEVLIVKLMDHIEVEVTYYGEHSRHHKIRNFSFMAELMELCKRYAL